MKNFSMFIPIRILFILLTLFFVQNVIAKNLCLGTFSSYEYNAEGGDILGVEIKVVHTRLGKQAAIQFSEGEPGELTVVTVTCDGSHFSFKIPKTNDVLSAQFEGTISKKNLSGKLTYENGASGQLILPRKKGFWD